MLFSFECYVIDYKFKLFNNKEKSLESFHSLIKIYKTVELKMVQITKKDIFYKEELRLPK